MVERTFKQEFAAFCAAQYSVSSPDELADAQRLEAEAAFMMGVNIGFYRGFGCLDDEAIALDKEIRAFGDDYLKRVEAAGISLGQRRS